MRPITMDSGHGGPKHRVERRQAAVSYFGIFRFPFLSSYFLFGTCFPLEAFNSYLLQEF